MGSTRAGVPDLDCVTLQAYSVDNGSEVQAMTGKLVDHRISRAARRLEIPAAAVALAGLLNVSVCSNQTGATAISAASPSALVVPPALTETEAGSATLASRLFRRLGTGHVRIPMDDVPEGSDHLAGASS
jgi:hypothetical protein